MLLRFMIGSGVVLFTIEHPYFVAFGALIYFFNEIIKPEEKTMLRDFASKGTTWLSNLNAFSRLKGLSMREGREVVSAVTESIFTNLEPDYLREVANNEDLHDKLNSFVVNYVNAKNSPDEEDEWEKWAYPLQEHEDLDEYDVEFIKLTAPNFDWTIPYTRKEHRQLIKTMKAAFRNSDGSISDELGDRCVTLIKQTLEIDNMDIPEIILEDREASDYIVDYVVKHGTGLVGAQHRNG